MVIDAHQHFWHYDPVRDSWIDDSMEKIRRDFLPDDLQPLYRSLGIDGSVAVQAAPQEEETHFLLELAESRPFIRAVVGWIDFEAPGLQERLDELNGFRKLAGFRHILQAEDPSYMLRETFLRGIEALAPHRFTYDLLLYPRHLKAAAELVAQFPEQTFILDHLAKPPVRSGEIEPWREQLLELAAFDNVCCKLSGLVTEADWNRWNRRDLRPYIQTAIEAFGPARLLFGSDWPVCLLAGSLEQVFETIREAIAPLSESDRRAILGENAAELYHIS